PAISLALDRRVFHEFFQLAATAVASKGISIALPLSGAGLSSATLVNDLLVQLEIRPLPPRWGGGLGRRGERVGSAGGGR
ncbi:hypothetical protein ACNIRN_25595, partial [Escherichia coli]